MRQVRDLRWAKKIERPECIGLARPRARAKKLGIAYERAVAKAIGAAGDHGSWFSFADALGSGFCQTDEILRVGRVLVVVEVKYTWIAAAHEKLERLYLPVVERALGRPTIGIVLCKRIGRDFAAIPSNDWQGALFNALAGRRTALLWTPGCGTLRPPADLAKSCGLLERVA